MHGIKTYITCCDPVISKYNNCQVTITFLLGVAKPDDS